MKITFLLVLILIFHNSLYPQWISVNKPEPFIYELIQYNSDILAGTYYGIYKSNDEGLSWQYMCLKRYIIDALDASGPIIFAGKSIDGGAFFSTDYGKEWDRTFWGNIIRVVHISGSNVFVGTLDGVFMSTNQGWNFNKVSNTFPVEEIIETNAGIFAGGLNVYFTSNSGLDWKNCNFNNHVHAIAECNNNVFVGSDEGLYVSSGNYEKWELTTLKNVNVSSIVVSKDDIIFAGTTKGIYMSKNNGKSWIDKNDNLGNLEVNHLLIKDNYIFAVAYKEQSSSVIRRNYNEIIY